MKYTIILLLSATLLGACSNSEANYDAAPTAESRAHETDNAPANSALKKEKRADAPSEIVAYASSPVGNTTTLFDYKSTDQENSLAPNDDLIADRMLIWNGDLEFRVKNLDKSSNSVRMLCKKHDAYISDMEREEKSWELSTFITIRVANEHFHDLVADLKGESDHLDVARITSEDVTEEYVDIENRLETKRKARERYIEILRSKTGTIEEVIQAEEAIRRITEEIEAKEGRLRFLSDQMEFSTITLRMYKPIENNQPQIADTETYGDQAKASFSAGWDFIKGFGLVLIAIWPVLLILTALIFWKRKWFGRFFRRNVG